MDDLTQCLEEFDQLLALILAEWWRHGSGRRQETIWARLSNPNRDTVKTRTDQCMTKSMHPKRLSVRLVGDVHERGETP